MLVLALALAAVVGGLFYLQARAPQVTVDSQALSVDCLFYGDTYSMQDVTSVSLRQQLPAVLARTNGFAAGGVLRGWFRLRDLGEGKLFIEHGMPPYVVVTLRRGFVIINYADPRRTEALFIEIMKHRTAR